MFSVLLQHNLINIALFQVAWFLCVYFFDSAWVVTGSTLVCLFLHQLFLVADRREWLLVSVVVIIGVSVDAVLGKLGIMNFSEGQLLPLWLLCLWILFSTLLNHSLRWLHDRLFLAGFMGALLAPVSYWAGGKFTGTEFGQSATLSLAIIGGCWALIFPLSLWLARRMNQPLSQ